MVAEIAEISKIPYIADTSAYPGIILKNNIFFIEVNRPVPIKLIEE